MSLFNAFQSLWSSGSDASAPDDASLHDSPAVNIDGTPMASDWMDVCGRPFGVADFGGHQSERLRDQQLVRLQFRPLHRVQRIGRVVSFWLSVNPKRYPLKDSCREPYLALY